MSRSRTHCASDGAAPSTAPVVEPLVIDSRTLAAMLQTSKSTLFRMLAAGKLPRPFQMGQQPRWQLSEIRSWVAGGMPPRDRWEALQKASSRGER